LSIKNLKKSFALLTRFKNVQIESSAQHFIKIHKKCIKVALNKTVLFAKRMFFSDIFLSKIGL